MAWDQLPWCGRAILNQNSKINALCYLKFFDLSEIRGDVTMRDGRTNNDKQLKIELLSQWKLEAEFRNLYNFDNFFYHFTFARTILETCDI